MPTNLLLDYPEHPLKDGETLTPEVRKAEPVLLQKPMQAFDIEAKHREDKHQAEAVYTSPAVKNILLETFGKEHQDLIDNVLNDLEQSEQKRRLVRSAFEKLEAITPLETDMTSKAEEKDPKDTDIFKRFTIHDPLI